MIVTIKKHLIVLVISLLAYMPLSIAQNADLLIARQYVAQGDCKKAVSIFETISKSVEAIPSMHDDYLECLINESMYKEAGKYLKKVLKNFPDPSYKIDYGRLLLAQEKDKEAEKYYEAYLESISSDNNLLEQSGIAFYKLSMYDYAETCFLQIEKNGHSLFFEQLAKVYLDWNKIEEMISYCLDKHFLYMQEGIQEFFESNFDILIKNNTLEISIIRKMQQFPGNILLNKMLVWSFLKQDNFSRAFVQTKAIDRLQNSNGDEIFKLGNIALEREFYDNAIEIFNYVVTNYRYNHRIYLQSKYLLIKSKEEA